MKSYKAQGYDGEEKLKSEKGTVNEEKLQNNLSRAKARVKEYAICNDWELFVTFTLSPEKYDRYNLQKYIKDLTQFIRDYKKKYKLDIKYLILPERHIDGAWHIHGFLLGLPLQHLKEFQLSEHLPYKIIDRIKSGKRIFTWEAYEKRFGYTSIEIIENHEASSNYITKYITKDALRTITALNAHIYYCSKGLKRAEIIEKNYLRKGIENPDYENDYVVIKWSNNIKEMYKYF